MSSGDTPTPSTQPRDKIESTLDFLPKFAADGLIPAIVTDANTGKVLMFAHMNQDALERTLAMGSAYFWSRSRSKLWLKGEDSGNVLKIIEVRTDCDQDVLWLSVAVQGAGVACHTGERSCFYRRVVRSKDGGTVLEFAAMPRHETRADRRT